MPETNGQANGDSEKNNASGNQGGANGAEGGQTLYEVKVGGETVRVPLSELQGGYSRHQDYTRKTQALSEREKQLEDLITEKATELYLQAIAEGRDPEKGGNSKADGDGANNQGNRSGKADNPELAQRLEKMEKHLSAQQQMQADAAADSQLKGIMSGLVKKYPNMDPEKVMIRFYNEAKDSDNIEEVFERLAKKSHEDSLSYDQGVIDRFVKSKTQGGRFSGGEHGGSGAQSGEKKEEPPKTFEEARERAEKRLAISS